MKIKMEGMDWDYNVPHKPGDYLFYGYLYKPNGEEGYFEESPRLHLVSVMCDWGNTFYVGDGQTLQPNCSVFGMLGLWAKVSADFTYADDVINEMIITRIVRDEL